MPTLGSLVRPVVRWGARRIAALPRPSPEPLPPGRFDPWLAARLPTLWPLARGLAAWTRWALGSIGSLARRCAWRFALRIRRSPLTLAIVTINLMIFLVVDARGGKSGLREFCQAMGVSDQVLHGDWWRILSSAWTHGSFHHVWANCTYLLPVGLLLEPAIGTLRFGAIYGVSTVGSGLAVVFFDVNTAIGSSGAVYGILAALLVCRVSSHRLIAWSAWLWAVGQAAGGLTDPNAPIAYAGHIGGLLAGLMTAALVVRAPESTLIRRRRVLFTSLGAIALVAALAPDPQWHVVWQTKLAQRASQSGPDSLAAIQWEKVETLADPHRYPEAEALIWVLNRKTQTGDELGTRRLLEEMAPTLQQSDVFLGLGENYAWSEPCNDSLAQYYLLWATTLDPDDPRPFQAMAEVCVWTNDSTIYSPWGGLRYAIQAIQANDGKATASQLRTLAWARAACGQGERGVATMRRAVALADTDSTDYGEDLLELQRSMPFWSTMKDRDHWLDLEDERDADQTPASEGGGT